MLNNEKTSFCNKNVHEIHARSDFRLNNNPCIKLSSVGQCLMFVFGWGHRVSSQYIYKLDCFPMMIHWINKEVSTLDAPFFLV